MKIIDKVIKLEDKKQPLRLIPIGDIHIGNVNCDKKYLEKLIKWIEEKENTYIIGMGDFVDAIIPTGDARFDMKSIDLDFLPNLSDLPMAQVEYLKDLLYPLREKIIALLPGNHEEKFRKTHYIDPILELCRYLECEMGDIMTYIRIRFDRSQFHTSPVIVWAHHGWFGGRKRGNKVNQLEDIASGYSADLYLTAHSHDLFATTKTYIELPVKGNTINVNKRIFCNTGTFLRTVSLDGTSYSEARAYMPTKVGVVRIDIYPRNTGKPDIHVRE